MTDDTMPLLDALLKRGGGDFLKELAEEVLGRLMAYDVEGQIGAGRYERNEERTTQRNGYRHRAFDTRLGTLDLKIPKLRKGSYFPGFLEPRRTTEQALAGAWRGRPALYLTSGGGTTGRGTLIDAILRAAGLRNAQQGVGFREVSLESLVAQPPEAIVGGFFDRALVARQPWGVGRHGVLKALMRKRALVSLPADRLGCPAWFSADAVAAIADAAPGKLGR